MDNTTNTMTTTDIRCANMTHNRPATHDGICDLCHLHQQRVEKYRRNMSLADLCKRTAFRLTTLSEFASEFVSVELAELLATRADTALAAAYRHENIADRVRMGGGR
jgi:hypothetical protein